MSEYECNVEPEVGFHYYFGTGLLVFHHSRWSDIYFMFLIYCYRLAEGKKKRKAITHFNP